MERVHLSRMKDAHPEALAMHPPMRLQDTIEMAQGPEAWMSEDESVVVAPLDMEVMSMDEGCTSEAIKQSVRVTIPGVEHVESLTMGSRGHGDETGWMEKNLCVNERVKIPVSVNTHKAEQGHLPARGYVDHAAPIHDGNTAPIEPTPLDGDVCAPLKAYCHCTTRVLRDEGRADHPHVGAVLHVDHCAHTTTTPIWHGIGHQGL